LIGGVMLEAAAHRPQVGGQKESLRRIERDVDVRAAVPAVQRVLAGNAFDDMMRNLLEGAAKQRGLL
jgi:hypothetical protein